VEPDAVLEQARQKLVEIVQLMMRYMDRRSRDEGQLFRGLVERQVPGMPAMIDQGGTTAQIATRINDFQKPGWEGRLTQAFGRMSTQHPVFADPAVRAASNEYLAMQPRMQERLVALTNEMRDLGAPGAAATYRRLGQETSSRATAPGQIRPTGAAPRSAAGRATPPPPGAGPQPQPRQAPGGARPTPPQPTQTPGPGASPTPPPRSTGPQPARPQPAQPQPGPGPTQAAQEGTQRTLAVQTSEPVALDARIVQGAGKVTVRADPSCTAATLTIRTGDQNGPAADAVRTARLEPGPNGQLTARAEVNGPSTTVVTHSNNGSVQTIQSSSNGLVMTGGHIGRIDIDNGRIRIGDVRGGAFAISRGQGGGSLQIDAVVPEGSTVVARTESAAIETHGNLGSVEAHSVDGPVTIGTADRTDGTGTPGSPERVDAHSVSGPISVHADRPSDVRAGSVSGPIKVTASSPEVAGQMRVDADSISGPREVPAESRGSGSQTGDQPQRSPDGARDNHTARQTQNRQAGTGLGG
jgi:hypothetical protein